MEEASSTISQNERLTAIRVEWALVLFVVAFPSIVNALYIRLTHGPDPTIAMSSLLVTASMLLSIGLGLPRLMGLGYLIYLRGVGWKRIGVKRIGPARCLAEAV